MNTINLTPQEYQGTPTQRHANYRTHNFQAFGPDDEARCLACDCRPGGVASWWPCGATIPTEGERVRTPVAAWYTVREEVVAFGSDMVRAGWLRTPSFVQEYYEHPQAWAREHAWWEAHGRPDGWTAWDEGADAGWPS